jgi:carboxyl-terminal processing protease
MKFSTRITIYAAMALSMAAGLGIGIAIDRREESPKLPTDLDEFVELVHRVGNQYVDPVAESELVRNAIIGMMQGLDAHSTYLDSTALADLTEQTRGRFAGVGMELGMGDGRIKVLTPLEGSPAAQAGLLSGDVLLAIDDVSLDGRTLTYALQALRGTPGSTVKLDVQRATGATEQITLTRALVNLVSVFSSQLEPGYGYVRISQFQETTGKELERAIEKLIEDNGAALDGLVLDLRNNPGGVLQAAVAVSDAFLTSGLIVYTKGRQASAELRFSASGDDLLDGAPLAVLINSQSASASEIVAGALQDHERALIIGTASFGKGTVQTVLPLQHDRAIKLTTAHYFTPNGRSIQKHGIDPDLVIETKPPGSSNDLLVAEALRQLRSTPKG